MRHLVLCLFLVATPGCAVLSAALAAMPKTAGHVDATNTMSVPVCQVCVVPPGTELGENCVNRLSTSKLEPADSARVDIPRAQTENQSEAWDVHVFGCSEGHGASPSGILRMAANTKLVANGAIGL